jgi:XTP/dITP diphosphohydrolase
MKERTKRIVLASNNAAKLEELRAILGKLSFEIIDQSECRTPNADETGWTFIENAILKARNAALYCGLPAIADDSGLEVDALDGAPGIFSARYAGAGATDADNNAKLLAALHGVPEHKRGAQFQCVVVYLRHARDPGPLICSGIWRGSILREARGDSGFGYDPIFYVSSHGCAAAELPPSVKNKISHRGRALRRLVGHLRRIDDQ